MAKGFQSWDEVTGHLHPVHRPPGGYPLTGLAVEYDLASQRIAAVTLTLGAAAGRMERRLRFRDVFPSGTARGLLGWPFGYGVWVVDIGHWQWEGYRVAVLSDYEDADRLFVAASVEELTDPAPEANPRPPVGN